MCDETKLKRKHLPKKKKAEIMVPDNTTATNSPPPTNTFAKNVVFSVKNVELINPNSPSSSSHHHHPKKKRSQRPKPLLTGTTFPEKTFTTTSIASDIVFSVKNVGLTDPNSPSSSSQQHGLSRVPSKTSKSKPKTLSLASIVDRSTLIEAEGVEARVVSTMEALVKVFCVHTKPNMSMPWQMKRQHSTTSSGFVIGGRRVLTRAHSVEHHTHVTLRKSGVTTKYVATVLAIGTECDIGEGLEFVGWVLLSVLLSMFNF